jgi:O-acetyl-ADP-ribose deacetylase
MASLATAVAPSAEITSIESLHRWTHDPADAVPAVSAARASRLLDDALPHPRDSFAVCDALNDLVSVWRGDMTTLAADAIVNAANSGLLGGGGIDGAIHRAAGPGLRAECEALPYVDGVGRCGTGDAVVTGAHDLPSNMVIHTVGPMFCGDSESPYSGSLVAAALASCYSRSLDAATAAGAHSIAFPCISTGIYGYPPLPAAGIAAVTVRRWLEAREPEARPRVIFVTFMRSDYEAYREVLGAVFPRAAPAPVAATVEEQPAPPQEPGPVSEGGSARGASADASGESVTVDAPLVS